MYKRSLFWKKYIGALFIIDKNKKMILINFSATVTLEKTNKPKIIYEYIRVTLTRSFDKDIKTIVVSAFGGK